MADFESAWEIQRKLYGNKDITYQETDVVFRIAYEHFIKRCFDEDEKKRERFLSEWYFTVCEALKSGLRGNFINTIPLEPIKVFKNFIGRCGGKPPESFFKAEWAYEIATLNKHNSNPLDSVFYVSLPDKKSTKEILGNTNLFLFGVKHKEFSSENNYIFKFYRVGTLKRFGFNDYTKVNIEDKDFKSICYSWRNRIKQDTLVFGIASAYAKIMETLEKHNIPFITCGTDFYDEPWRVKFEMFAPPDYQRDIEKVFKLLPERIDGKKFFEKVSMQDPEFTDFIESHVCNYLTPIGKNKLSQKFDEDMMEITR